MENQTMYDVVEKVLHGTLEISSDRLEVILHLRQEELARVAKLAYTKSLIDFQRQCPIIKKEKEVRNDMGQLMYRFAPLDHIVTQVGKLIAECGFSYRIDTRFKKDSLKGICIVSHSEGHTESTTFEALLLTGTKRMSPTQIVEGTQTIVKRVVFCNAFGILTGDEEVNGTGDSSIESTVTPGTLELLQSELTRCNVPIESVLQHQKVTALRMLKEEDALKLIERMKTLKP